jgi:hypothetical protein
MNSEHRNLGEVDSKVVQLLASCSDTSFSFQGMKRSLKVHQEKLSRSLNRLVNTGLVGKNDDGYAITKKGLKVSGISPSYSQPLAVGSSYLPNDVDLTSAQASLKGKWFSGMRWLGSTPTSQGTDLNWVTDDGEIQIRLSFKDRFMEVSLVSFPPGDESRARDVASRLHAKIVNALYRTMYRQDS